MMLECFLFYCPIVINITQHPSIEIGFNIKQQKLLKELAFTRADWTLLMSTRNVLKSPYEATKILSGQTYNTMGVSYIVVKNLKKCSSTSDSGEEKFEGLLKQNLLQNLEYYFGDMFISKEQHEASMVRTWKYFYLLEAEQRNV